MSNPNQNLAKLKKRLTDQEAMIGKAFAAKRYRYKGVQGLILAQGQAFLDTSPKSITPGRLKQCYANCFDAALRDESLIYCEGYAWSDDSLFLTPHAWLIDQEGRVIEPTPVWREDIAQTAYFGIPFSLAYAFDMTHRNRTYGILENAYRNHYQLRREGFPDGAIWQPLR